MRDELYLYQTPVREQFADADRRPSRVRRWQVFILYRHERADVRALVAVEMGAVEDVEGRELYDLIESRARRTMPGKPKWKVPSLDT